MSAPAFDCDVLIIGGGPTGVTLASLLALRGVSVIVAEKEAEVFPLPRAAHIDHEGMRILQEAGAAEAVMATSRRADAYEFRNAKGKVLMAFRGASSIGPGGWPNANMIHQPSVEAALRSALAAHAPEALRGGWEMLSFHKDAQGITAHFATPEGERSLSTRWLVGADGARSPVRRACGITFEDLGFEEPWLVVDVLVDDPARLPTANLQICDPARPTTCVLMGEGRHRWEFMILPGEDPEALRAPASVERLLAPWNVEGAVRIERTAIYTFRARIAEQWRKGRVLLAGDAAHQTPPFAGQGMCSGLRDAANLAWKLAAVLKDDADDTLLDTNQPERAPNLRATIEMACLMGKMVCITSRLGAWMRDAKLGLAKMLGKLPDGPPAYPPLSQGVILTGSPAAGQYFPQAIASDGKRLDDVLGTGAWFIDSEQLAEARLAPFAAELQAWLDHHGAHCVAVRPDRYVYGTGERDRLVDAWKAAVAA